jgi:hypothetical protein
MNQRLPVARPAVSRVSRVWTSVARMERPTMKASGGAHCGDIVIDVAVVELCLVMS